MKGTVSRSGRQKLVKPVISGIQRQDYNSATATQIVEVSP
jgi:hypothetical protein